jgi:N-acetylmuramic acid 6-phosphate etherase
MTPINTDERRPRRAGTAAAVLALTLILMAGPGRISGGPSPQTAPEGGSLLKLLGIVASPESVDYVVRKTPFQLHTLLTEQRHTKTWTLSDKIAKDTEGGLRMLFGVDDDIAAKLAALVREAADASRLRLLVESFEEAIRTRRKIYIYGCGATGRLAKQVESAFWRPFWNRIKADREIWEKCAPHLDPAVENELVGEMTGADRALISSLEGFEDLQLIGRLQLHDRGIKPGDVVVAVTEGGETSSVIGTIQAALDDLKAVPGFSPLESRKKLFFIYNNPDERLRPFERSRTVIDEPGITKINLTTGPQAITGSTRMQATTIETFVVGSALETAVERVLRSRLNKKEMARLGFAEETTLETRLAAFAPLLAEIKRNAAEIARLTDLEAKAYASARFTTYFADEGLITVFIDSTERSPTFRLYPLDTVREPNRKCWIQVWTSAADPAAAWKAFLGRSFRGLDPLLYRKPFESEIDDVYLKEKALLSLSRAGDDQAGLYDFSFGGTNLARRAPKKSDLAVLALIGAEVEESRNRESKFAVFAKLAVDGGAGVGLISVRDRLSGASPAVAPMAVTAAGGALTVPNVEVRLTVSSDNDPMRIRAQMALKMVLNAHSTAVMAKLGKVIGNTMTNVSPSNLKLIGRATYLIQLHVNDILGKPEWVRLFGSRRPISYGEANAVLFDSIAFMKDRAQDAGQAAEVPISIVRILESFRRKIGATSEEALAIVQEKGLAAYLAGAATPVILVP